MPLAGEPQPNQERLDLSAQIRTYVAALNPDHSPHRIGLSAMVSRQTSAPAGARGEIARSRAPCARELHLSATVDQADRGADHVVETG